MTHHLLHKWKYKWDKGVPTHTFTCTLPTSLLTNCIFNTANPLRVGSRERPKVSQYSCRNGTAALNVFHDILKSGASTLMICKLNSPGCKMHWDSLLC